MNQGSFRLPVIFFPDGSTLVEPDHLTLAQKVGLQTEASQPFYDVIIVGAGPAGLGAAVYSASEGLKTLLIDKEATGGQAGTSSRIENYLGFPKGLSGADLAQRATVQAARLGRRDPHRPGGRLRACRGPVPLRRSAGRLPNSAAAR